jgi:hypothetical protein
VQVGKGWGKHNQGQTTARQILLGDRGKAWMVEGWLCRGRVGIRVVRVCVCLGMVRSSFTLKIPNATSLASIPVPTTSFGVQGTHPPSTPKGVGHFQKDIAWQIYH